MSSFNLLLLTFNIISFLNFFHNLIDAILFVNKPIIFCQVDMSCCDFITSLLLDVYHLKEGFTSVLGMNKF